MKRYHRECIERVKPYVPGKPIEEVQRELELNEVVKLASNEHPIGPSPKALRAIRENLGTINRYPDSSCYYLKKALAKHLSVKEENLLIGNGSDETITLAVKAFVNEGDEVVIATPTFLIYEIAAQVANAMIRLVPMRDLRYDLKAMAAAAGKAAKMVFIANPDNPTGTYVRRAELEEFLDAVGPHTIVFLDEAYFEFAKDLGDYPDGLAYLGRPNLIVARTFSKAYGLAGLRVGYAASTPELIGYLDRVREPFNVNMLAQVAARAALDDRKFLKATLAHVKKEKAYLAASLGAMGLECVESATNFILVNVRVDCRALFERLLREGVIVRDMQVWGFDTYIRVTAGTRAENRKFLGALEKALRAIRAPKEKP